PADEMQTAGRDRQLFGEFPDLWFRQMSPLHAAVGLCRRQTIQRGWKVMVHIPVRKWITFAQDLCKRMKVLTIPETFYPQPIQRFHQSVALRLAGREEDQFNTHIQTESDKSAEMASRLLTSRRRRVIVQLQSMRQTQCWPAFQRMVAPTGRPFIRTDRLRQ